jgi:ribosomal protein S18 acetylase RimI-like enzyme
VGAALRVEPLGAGHQREGFSCGVPALDRYFNEFATQDIKRGLSNCFVAVDETGVVAGYYSFAASSIPLSDLPAGLTKRLPRYGVVPAGLIGRLAVDLRFRGRRIGGALIIDAARRAAAADPAVYALLVDAKDDAAVAFYARMGFQRFQSRPMSLFLPLATALRAVERS